MNIIYMCCINIFAVYVNVYVYGYVYVNIIYICNNAKFVKITLPPEGLDP